MKISFFRSGYNVRKLFTLSTNFNSSLCYLVLLPWGSYTVHERCIFFRFCILTLQLKAFESLNYRWIVLQDFLSRCGQNFCWTLEVCGAVIFDYDRNRPKIINVQNNSGWAPNHLSWNFFGKYFLLLSAIPKSSSPAWYHRDLNITSSFCSK